MTISRGYLTTDCPEPTEWWRMALAFSLNRWRIFCSTIMLNPNKVFKITMTCVCLRNVLGEVWSDTYLPPALAEWEDGHHRLMEGIWRTDGLGAMRPFQHEKPHNSPMAAKVLRDKLKSYLVSPAGQVRWKDSYI